MSDPTETAAATRPVQRILLTALGGEGGGVLMNWIVASARAAGHPVQATSVPGVAQRTGSTSYYIEIADPSLATQPVLGLVPLPGRVDVLVSSELVETARMMTAGFVSPSLTTLISSTSRTFSTAEKMQLGDGRYSQEAVRRAAEGMAKESYLLDLSQLATENGTFISATMFGALCGAEVLPWDVSVSQGVLSDARSRAGFDAAAAEVRSLKVGIPPAVPDASLPPVADQPGDLPHEVAQVIGHGVDRCRDFQDEAYADLYHERVERLAEATDLDNHRAVHALTEACRRLALWMAYEDVARVAYLKTRPERFDRIRSEAQIPPGAALTVVDYMKPRAEEIADIMPAWLGRRIMTRVERGGRFPLLGRGINIRSNGVFGYWSLRMVAAMRRFRRRSYRYAQEQAAIGGWLEAMDLSLRQAPDFAESLAELPRVLKGYSDTQMRGKRAYAQITEHVVQPALVGGDLSAVTPLLRRALAAALADDAHEKLDAVLAGEVEPVAVPIFRLRS